MFGLGLLVLPVTVVAAASWLSEALTGYREPLVTMATRYSFTLVPLGFGMWLAHYGFHFLTGGLTIIPVTQSLLADLGLPALGQPDWGLGPLVPVGWLLPLQLFMLEGGLLLSMWSAYKLSQARHRAKVMAFKASMPWWVLAGALFGTGVWLLLQPMEMRGTFGAG